MRLRLEPTINISDQVRVVAQIDVFDNLILGSTPDSLISASQPDLRTNVAQAAILSNSQNPPGQNTFTSAISPKRVWGEVDGQLGSLRFGRMPWHFGRGMYFNKGDCADCDGAPQWIGSWPSPSSMATNLPCPGISALLATPGA